MLGAGADSGRLGGVLVAAGEVGTGVTGAGRRDARVAEGVARGLNFGTDSSLATRLGARGVHSTTDSVTVAVAPVGAEPMPPDPAGSLIDGGVAAGAPTVQPMATATGRPRATMLTNMDLGVRRMP